MINGEIKDKRGRKMGGKCVKRKAEVEREAKILKETERIKYDKRGRKR